MKNIFAYIIAGLGLFVAFIGLLFLISLLIAWPVMALWNWVAVAVLGAKVITFWQSWGLLLLTGLLFRSSGKSS